MLPGRLRPRALRLLFGGELLVEVLRDEPVALLLALRVDLRLRRVDAREAWRRVARRILLLEEGGSADLLDGRVLRRAVQVRAADLRRRRRGLLRREVGRRGVVGGGRAASAQLAVQVLRDGLVALLLAKLLAGGAAEARLRRAVRELRGGAGAGNTLQAAVGAAGCGDEAAEVGLAAEVRLERVELLLCGLLFSARVCVCV